MPRKKVTPTETAPPEPTTSNESAEPKKRRPARKKAEEPAAAVASAPEPEVVEKPQRKGLFGKAKPAVTPKKVEEPAPAPAVEEPKPKQQPRRGRGRSEAAPADVVAEQAPATQVPPKEAETAAKTSEPRGRNRNRRSPRVEEPRAEAQTPDPPKAEAEQPEAKRSRGRRPSGKQAVGTKNELDLLLEEDPDLPVPSFRPRQTPPARVTSAPKEEHAEEGNLAPRKSRRRRRKDQPDTEITAAAALEKPAEQEPPKPREREDRRGRRDRQERPQAKEAAPVEPEKPKEQPRVGPPPKPVIPIPEDAPQVVLRDGIPTLVRNHRVYPPFTFFGSASDEQRAKTVFDEIKMAGEAGVHVHSHLVEFEVDPRTVDASVSFAAYMLNQTLKVDPEAQVLFRIVFIAPSGWHEQYPNARYMTADGELGEPSVCDDAFWNTAKQCLEKFIKQLRMLPAKESILGIHLERGEWFYAQGWGYDTSNAAKLKFREWARTRYRDEVVALRAAWFDGSVQFQTLAIPEYVPEEKAGEKFVRASRKERKWVDYHLFLSDSTVERIGDLAYAAKQSSEGYFLVGASYGYTFEWSHPASGHLSLGKLLRAPEIDFIAGPPSYRSREPGGAAPFPGPIDSFALNGKLYISEEDFKTSIGGRFEPDDFNPVIKTPQALESVHWRGAGCALAHGSGVSWMDLWGNGWLKTPVIWDRAAKTREALTRRMTCPLSEPDVAVFIDERALAYLVDETAFALLVQNVRESVLRAGLSAGFYLLSDLQHREKFPESKLYVFLNAWDVRPELRAAIKTRLQRDNKVLFWLYAAGLFDSGRESLERAREVTGIALKPQPFHSRAGTSILNRRHPLCEAFPDRGIVGGAKLEPSYFAIPEESTVLGEYSQTGLPSFVIREFHHEQDPHLNWKSVFLGEPLVTPALLRALGQLAGAHVWNFHEDVVHVRAPFLTVHCTGTGQRTLTLPSKWSAYDLQSGTWAAVDATSLRFHAIDGSTHTFMVGVKEELESILSANPEDLLRMETLPTKPENTIRYDAASFDVPIMRLDEWMEGGDADELSDDLLFKPRLVEEPEGDSEKLGRRKRRRGRGGRDRDSGSEETPSVRRDSESRDFDEDLGMSIVFRKRE